MVDFGGIVKLTRFQVNVETCEVKKITCIKSGNFFFSIEGQRYLPANDLFEHEGEAYVALLEKMAELREFAARRVEKNMKKLITLEQCLQERIRAYGTAFMLLQTWREHQKESIENIT